MPYYEVLCLAPGKLTRKQLGDVVTRTVRVFLSLGGVVTRLHPLGATGHGARTLAYPIRKGQEKFTTGYYVNVCAFSSPSALKEVCRRLSLDESILRLLPLKRPLDYAAAPPPDTEYTLPEPEGDPNDPSFALRELVREFERENPDGKNIIAAEGSLDNVDNVDDDPSVQAVFNDLRAVSTASAARDRRSPKGQASEDTGLQWLLGYSDEKKVPKK
jgi:ribosomal protein S6